MKPSPDVGKNIFVPGHYGFTDREALLSHIETQPFAQIFSAWDGNMRVTATPLVHVPKQDTKKNLTFVGHIARRNPHCAAIERGAEALAVFAGPNAYISSRWFVESQLVPTWSYVSVQLQGHFELIENEDETLNVLNTTIAHMESKCTDNSEQTRWRLSESPTDLVDRLKRGITAFYFRGSVIEGVRRLNQDKSEIDRRSIVDGLRRSPQLGAATIAALMQDDLKPVSE